MEPRFISQLRSCGNDIEAFNDSLVRPDQRNVHLCHEIVDKLVRFLHQSKYSVSKVVKGGSLSKGTSIKVKSDIDLVVFLNDYQTVADLQRNMGSILLYFQQYIKQDARWASQVEFTKPPNDWRITFRLKCHSYDHLHDVDLLVACDLSYESKSSIFERMRRLSPYDRTFYNVCFEKDQTDFVKTRPPRVKDLVRLVKHWKTIEDVDIKSYCIELIVIKKWMEWGRPENFNIRDKLKAILLVLSTFRSIRITWPEEYDINRYGGVQSSPVVMDPTDPFDNPGGKVENVAVLERKAVQTYNYL